MNLKPILLAAVFLAGPSIWAQQPPPGGPRPDPLAENFFPPELLMQNQQAIGLTAEQQANIRADMQKAQARFADLQWQLSGEQEKMAALIKQDRIDESQLLAQLDKVLAVETEVKKAHLSLLARIKNVLTPDQQAKLRELKRQMRPPMRGGQPGPVGDGPPPGPPPQE